MCSFSLPFFASNGTLLITKLPFLLHTLQFTATVPNMLAGKYRKGNCVQIFASFIYAILWICLCSAKAAAIVVLRYLTQLALELQETKVVAPFVGFTDAGHTNTSVVNR